MNDRHACFDNLVWDVPDGEFIPPGRALASLRQSQGLSRSDIARAAGAKNVGKFCQRLTEIERGKRVPNNDLRARLDGKSSSS